MKVSKEQYDAWKVKLPSEIEGQCHTDSPYFYEFNPEEEDCAYYELNS